MTEQEIAQKRTFVKTNIASIPDHPKPGIMFRDITSLMENIEAYQATIDLLKNHYKGKQFTKVVGTESRGFLFGAPLALVLGIGFVPVRKPGKLPRKVIAQSYELEYGEDTLEIHCDAINADDKVLVIDDLLATGGTIEATVKLIRQLGGEVSDAAFVISLPEIGGEEKLKSMGVTPYAICQFDGH